MIRNFTATVSLLGCAFFLFTGNIWAQKQTKLDIALRHIEQQREHWKLAPSDIADMAVTDNYSSAHNGLTHIYFIQRHAGIELYNAILNVNILPDGKVLSAQSRFMANLSEKVNATHPILTPEQAVLAAADYLQIPVTKALQPLRKESDKIFYFAGGELSDSEIKVQLRYQRINNKEAWLAWDLNIDQKTTPDHWSMRIDALTGEMLNKYNYTVYCKQFHTVGHQHREDCEEHFQPVQQALTTQNLMLNDNATYNVFAVPVESPIHGQRRVVVNPADTVASPFGWHDVNGIEGAEYLITRGNNVHAFADTADNDVSIGDEPNGGEGLIFDFPFDPAAAPQANREFAITQLFYMNNILHDFTYAYGFDEASGNFQQLNYTGKGAGGDYVLAHGQDGGGISNANFSTPPDGLKGVMQMYLWEKPSNLLTVTAPASVAGVYVTGEAQFGPAVGTEPIEGEVVIVNDGSSLPTWGCNPPINDVRGKIVIVDRGDCFFTEKTYNIQQAGGIAVIVCNNVPGTLTMGAGSSENITIPAILIDYTDCQRIRQFVGNGLQLSIFRKEGASYIDGTIDNGIIAHEYGHGISNRLTGGPHTTSCLYNEEQMGEGWSDFFTLVTTVKPGDAGAKRRGVGTYVQLEDTSGFGIRAYPYSTDMSINPQTMDDMVGASVPHGIGSVWTQALWDMYWIFVEEYGFDEDQVHGTGGNNMAIQLVMDGMKLQACGPGFLDGRDAILDADKANYGGANQCLIWKAFARRGMGWSANQRDFENVNDGSEGFDVPPTCIQELKIEKKMTDLVKAGDTVTVELVIINHKEEAVSQVVVSDILPDGLNFMAGSVTISSLNPGEEVPYTLSGNVLTFEFDELSSGATDTIRYQLRTPADKFSYRHFFDDVENGDEGWIFEPLQGDIIWWVQPEIGIDGSSAWMVADERQQNDQTFRLVEPILITGAQPVLRFYHKFNTEWAYDGGIVQVSKDNGATWEGVASKFIRGGYNKRINLFGLVRERGYSGVQESEGFEGVYIDLSDYIGEEILVRFRFGTDNDVAFENEHYGTGWTIDNIEFMDMLNYNSEACITSAEGDQACAEAPGRGTIIDTEEELTAVEELNQQSLSVTVFPNPANDFLHVGVSNSNTGKLNISVFSTDGRLLLQKQEQAQKGFSTIPLSVATLAPGMYIVKVQVENSVVVKKVVIN